MCAKICWQLHHLSLDGKDPSATIFFRRTYINYGEKDYYSDLLEDIYKIYYLSKNKRCILRTRIGRVWNHIDGHPADRLAPLWT